MLLFHLAVLLQITAALAADTRLRLPSGNPSTPYFTASNGSLLSFPDAVVYCKARGGQLPTMCLTGDKDVELRRAAAWVAAADDAVGFSVVNSLNWRGAWMAYHSLDTWGFSRWADVYTSEALPSWNWDQKKDSKGLTQEGTSFRGEGLILSPAGSGWLWRSPSSVASNVVCQFGGYPTTLTAGCGNFEDREQNLNISPTPKPSVYWSGIPGSVACAPGYRLSSGNGTAYCSCISGQYRWYHETTCSQIFCENAAIDHGNPYSDEVAAGSSVPVTCDEGYQITGGAKLGCSITGAWVDIPSCELKTCPSLTFENVKVELGYAFGSSKVDCRKGFHAVPQKLNCTSGGSWASTPKCAKFCYDPYFMGGSCRDATFYLSVAFLVGSTVYSMAMCCYFWKVGVTHDGYSHSRRRMIRFTFP